MRQDTRGVEVRLAERSPDRRRPRMRESCPRPATSCPAPRWARQGGGSVAVDPTDHEGRKSVQKYFQVDVQLPGEKRPVNVGGRAYVRFDHGWEPIAFQWYREARQLFLSRLNV